MLEATYKSCLYRAVALTSQNHVTEYFHVAKERGVHWQLNGNYCLTCTPGRVAARSNRHGKCATATVDTVVLRKFQAACVTVQITTFLPRMKETEYNRGRFGLFYGR